MFKRFCLQIRSPDLPEWFSPLVWQHRPKRSAKLFLSNGPFLQIEKQSHVTDSNPYYTETQQQKPELPSSSYKHENDFTVNRVINIGYCLGSEKIRAHIIYTSSVNILVM